MYRISIILLSNSTYLVNFGNHSLYIKMMFTVYFHLFFTSWLFYHTYMLHLRTLKILTLIFRLLDLDLILTLMVTTWAIFWHKIIKFSFSFLAFHASGFHVVLMHLFWFCCSLSTAKQLLRLTYFKRQKSVRNFKILWCLSVFNLQT